MFELLHDLAYDHEGRDRWQYRTRAQTALKEPPHFRGRAGSQRVVELSKYSYVDLVTHLELLERWTDADVHRPNCVLYAGYAQPELRKHMSELVFVPREQETEEMFRGHRLLYFHCDHEKETDVAICECGWASSAMPNVGAAFDAWAAHLSSKNSLDKG